MNRVLQPSSARTGIFRLRHADRGEHTGAATDYGLVWTHANRFAVAAVVLALFLERFERIELDGSYPILPIPDLLVLSAVALFAAKVAFDLSRRGMRLRPLGWKDLALAAFVALLGLLSSLAVLTQPPDVTSGVQVLKTYAHLLALLGVALLVGHALSRHLVAFALHVYFVGAVAVAALSIVQALDQNLMNIGISDALDLVSRAGANGFVQPCSIFSEPAYLGYVSLGGVIVGLSLVSERHRIAAALGCGVCVIGIMLAAAAGPIAVAAPIGIYALVVRRRLFPTGVAPIVLGLAAVAALVWVATPVGDTLWHRAAGVSTSLSGDGSGAAGGSGARPDASFDLRRDLNRASIDAWKEAPLTGVGVGNGRLNLAGQVDFPWLPATSVQSTNAFNSANAYINLLMEAGPLAVAALVAVLFALWWRSRSAPPRLDELTRVFIVLLALQFFIINPLIMPPVWFWAAQRLALQDE